MTDTTVEPIVIVGPSEEVREIENLIRLKQAQLGDERSLRQYQRESLAAMDRIIKRTESEIQRLQRKLQRSIYVYGDETPENPRLSVDLLIDIPLDYVANLKEEELLKLITEYYGRKHTSPSL